ncbi:FCS-Like Zinc finger 8-like [Hibiscus syriacus]|uniref:FCS-Like Zinc finger 8-like n=1 Tax=Hibiscus syriacus TaxID=106335 RepID=UPI001924D8AC|nr:FCS-Like Zinc finger 8-like [Hibiscus syriacus]
MLRNRSRAVSSNKQALMVDHGSQSSSSQKNLTSPTPSFLCSPRFKAFIAKHLTEPEVLKSPTSILDKKPSFPPCNNPLGYEPKSPENFSSVKHRSPENPEPKGIALAIVDTLEDKPKLRVQIPLIPPSPYDTSSPKSPGDFGIKTRNSHIPSSPFGACMKDSPTIINGRLPVEEMELSEDYTCVISYGPNPKTTHISDDCVVASCCSASQSFLSFCYTCKKNLHQKIDIYIYRGDKAFCSQECRYQEMVLHGEEN